MSRKRSHSSRRPNFSSGSERSYHEYLLSAPAPVTSRTELMRMVRGGEDTYLELKVRFSNTEKIVAEIIALANTGGGAIVFGVNDQLRVEGVDDPEAVEESLRELCARQILPPVFPYINKVAFDNGRRVVMVEVDGARGPHRTLDDRFYLREGAIKRETTCEELSAIYGDGRLRHFEEVPVFTASATDIDESLFWSYVRGVNPGPWGDTAKEFPTGAVMRDMGLALKLGDHFIPNLAGFLLFGDHPRVARLTPRAELTMTRYSGPAPQHQHAAELPVVEQSRARGNLFRQFESAMHFLTRYVDLWEQRPSRRAIQEAAPENSAVAVARANYHRGVIIAALTNLLAHRDWASHTAQSRIHVYDDAIEFGNPAQPVELPFVSLRYGMASPPNPRLKTIMTRAEYGLPAAHGGIPMIMAEAAGFARRAPELTGGVGFRLKIYGLS
ncbi:MAG: helix-turn-helix domain-containing protein [Blastocatellia bacterium]